MQARAGGRGSDKVTRGRDGARDGVCGGVGAAVTWRKRFFCFGKGTAREKGRP